MHEVMARLDATRGDRLARMRGKELCFTQLFAGDVLHLLIQCKKAEVVK